MEQFERELRKAMTRREPSRDFTARVLAATEAHEQVRSSRWRWLNRLWVRRMVPVFLVLLVISGVAAYHRHEHVVKGEQAKEQVLVAMRIAGAKMYRVQVQVREVER